MNDDPNKIFNILEKSICEVYGKPRVTKMNKAQYQDFFQANA